MELSSSSGVSSLHASSWLPQEILSHVFALLVDPLDLLVLALVSHDWLHASRESGSWKKCYLAHFHDLSPAQRVAWGSSYYQAFLQQLLQFGTPPVKPSIRRIERLEKAAMSADYSRLRRLLATSTPELHTTRSAPFTNLLEQNIDSVAALCIFAADFIPPTITGNWEVSSPNSRQRLKPTQRLIPAFKEHPLPPSKRRLLLTQHFPRILHPSSSSSPSSPSFEEALRNHRLAVGWDYFKRKIQQLQANTKTERPVEWQRITIEGLPTAFFSGEWELLSEEKANVFLLIRKDFGEEGRDVYILDLTTECCFLVGKANDPRFKKARKERPFFSFLFSSDKSWWTFYSFALMNEHRSLPDVSEQRRSLRSSHHFTVSYEKMHVVVRPSKASPAEDPPKESLRVQFPIFAGEHSRQYEPLMRFSNDGKHLIVMEPRKLAIWKKKEVLY